MPYENVYEVGLLDDLHNYFPQLLYRPERFGTVQDVLRYVRDATQRRFNLFDYGRRQYEESLPPRNTTHVRMHTDEADFVPILRTFINLPARVTRTTAGINSLFQDVVVNASQEIIDNASMQITLDEDADDNCPICQDRMRQGELIRKLNVCSHQFHKSCVDNWFLNDSVLCPTCRHDIRQPARVPSPMLTATATDGQPVMPALTPEQLSSPVVSTPIAASRNTLRQRSTEAQELLNTLFGLGQY